MQKKYIDLLSLYSFFLWHTWATIDYPKNAHLITLSDEKNGTMLLKALKTGFEENKGQSGPLSVESKN